MFTPSPALSTLDTYRLAQRHQIRPSLLKYQLSSIAVLLRLPLKHLFNERLESSVRFDPRRLAWISRQSTRPLVESFHFLLHLADWGLYFGFCPLHGLSIRGRSRGSLLVSCR